jgi:hypothetical protein
VYGLAFVMRVKMEYVQVRQETNFQKTEVVRQTQWSKCGVRDANRHPVLSAQEVRSRIIWGCNVGVGSMPHLAPCIVLQRSFVPVTLS